MNYTETLRKYFNEHKGFLFDVGYEHTYKFGMIEKKTFIRIIGRLADDGVLEKVSKGVYYISGADAFATDKIIEY